jgi:AraC family transcriptional regulator of adaptative response/methylated-DNA-[protein]-cysteine methyltransferase
LSKKRGSSGLRFFAFLSDLFFESTLSLNAQIGVSGLPAIARLFLVRERKRGIEMSQLLSESEVSNEVSGLMSANLRAEEADVQIRFAIGESSLGLVLVARNELGVCAILMGDDRGELMRDLQGRFPRANAISNDEDCEQLIAKVVGFVEAPAMGLDLPIDVKGIKGTAFQRRVWEALREIPVGSTASYADIANRIGSPRSVRAVAQACGANPLAVAIPCHRVVRGDGALSGYRWGVERKRMLLDREARA